MVRVAEPSPVFGFCRFVQESLHRDPSRGVSVRPPRVVKPLPQLHQVRPRSHHQPADADLSRHQVGPGEMHTRSQSGSRLSVLIQLSWEEVLVPHSSPQTEDLNMTHISLFAEKLYSQ